MKPVNELSACTFTVRFYGSDGAEFVPATAEWRLRNVSNKKLLKDWAALGVFGSSVDITVDASYNAVLNDRNPYEEMALAVRANANTSTEFNEEVVYKVKNLKAFK